VRKAVKSGLTIRHGPEHLPEFYEVYANSLSNKGFAIHKPEFFHSMAEHLNNHFHLLVACEGEKIVGGTIALKSRDIAIYPFQAATPDAARLGANTLMIWELMAYCADHHIGRIDMGESDPSGNTFQFKKNLGGIPTPVYYYSALNQFSEMENSGTPKRARKLSLRRALENQVLDKAPSFILRHLATWKTRKGRII
jgi:lipid II:glycine glycyltransferase (peptidoglycan interpeptide bridge formation enzyme)